MTNSMDCSSLLFSIFINPSQKSNLIIPDLWLKDSLAIYTTQKQLNLR